MDIKNQINEPVNADTMREFVKSYLLDYNAKNAVIRIGLSKLHADHIVGEFMSHPFVLNEIKRQEAEAAALASNPELVKQEVIKQLLSILKNDDPTLKAGDRISASKQLCDLLALAPKQAQTETAIQNIMVVPPQMDADSWSALAIQSQSDLKAKLEASL